MMSGEKCKVKSLESTLMERILEMRYTDLEEEKTLCKQLLSVSEGKGYFYGCAFAYIYIVDSHLGLGEYASCDFYLKRAKTLCGEYGFDDLMTLLCHFGGLYYQKLNDDQTALSYFIEGKELAENQGDIELVAKFNNNIGYTFGYRKNWEMGRIYFQSAYDLTRDHLTEENIPWVVTYLSNLAEACINVGDDSGARHALERCEELSGDDLYNKIRMGCSWCAYYAMVGDRKSAVREVDKLIDAGMFSMEEQFFISDMAYGLCSNMLAIGDNQKTKQLIDIIEKLQYNESLSLQYRIQCLKVRYWEKFEKTKKLYQAYKEYFEIVQRTDALEEDMLMNSLRSKIVLNHAKREQEEIEQYNKDLENASQLDQLTGLYNRRYFNKLVSKVINQKDVTELGFIMIDVDYFKEYNDFYGHFQGDNVLKAVAQVLSDNATEGIYVSRYGGDEFTCLSVNMRDEDVESYVQSSIATLRGQQIPHEKNAIANIITVSVGYSNEKFEMGMDSDKLLDLADEALYEVKRNGKNGYVKRVRKTTT